MPTENVAIKTTKATSPKLSFKTCAYFAAALIAATVVGFELGSSPWKTQANDWKAQAGDWKSQSDEWKAKATENAAYAARWETDAKKALDLAERCVTPSPTTN